MTRLLAALGAALLALPAQALDEDASQCLMKPTVVRYLHAVEDQIMDAWGLPPDGLANHEVVVRLRLESDGSLAHYKVISWTSQRLATSVAAALMVAAPFGPVPAGSECLVGIPILTTFRNPAD
jgi:hypothetical protein